MKSIFKENLGADYVADIISSCNQNGIQAIAEYTDDEILFYDPKNWLYCRHSDLIKDASLDGEIFDLFNNSKPEFRKQVMRPTKGKDFEDFAFEWNALQKEPDNPDIIKTKQCEMIRMDLKESVAAHAPGMDELVVDWYRDAYPTDTEMFAGLEDAGATFADVWNALKSKKDVYAAIGADDSIVRERVFQHLCELTGKKYDTVYNMWLRSANESNVNFDNPNDWSASEGEIEIMWTRDFPEAGIEAGNTDNFVVDYDNVAPDNEYDIENNGLRDEICRLISDEYPGLDFEPYDFDITNEREFWGDRE